METVGGSGRRQNFSNQESINIRGARALFRYGLRRRIPVGTLQPKGRRMYICTPYVPCHGSLPLRPRNDVPTAAVPYNPVKTQTTPTTLELATDGLISGAAILIVEM